MAVGRDSLSRSMSEEMLGNLKSAAAHGRAGQVRTTISPNSNSIFAPSPSYFKDGSKIQPHWTVNSVHFVELDLGPPQTSIAITQEGLVADLLLCPQGTSTSNPTLREQRVPKYYTRGLDHGPRGTYLGIPDCSIGNHALSRPAIVLQKDPKSQRFYRRDHRLYELGPNSPTEAVAMGLKTKLFLPPRVIIAVNLEEAQTTKITMSDSKCILPPEPSSPPLKVPLQRAVQEFWCDRLLDQVDESEIVKEIERSSSDLKIYKDLRERKVLYEVGKSTKDSMLLTGLALRKVTARITNRSLLGRNIPELTIEVVHTV
ncbi:hypothetical protein F5Y19DRAFT_481853 [Xylariaceae sp. FL1651]|nr:hypothetical protein F5Y19DRAFT_481853 [Xylariaceae sp. FL1651]